MTKLILAYCIENQYVAAKITSALNGKVEVEKIAFDLSHGIEVLKKAANNNVHPVLLLLSDNFLKSEKCMNDALVFIQSLGSAQRLIPVTTDGVYPAGTTGQFATVPTSFDRVSNVIQYMNHWQDRYLELRKLKADPDDTAHNEKVRIVRTISSEIGELLRYLRTIAFYSYDQFDASNFIILYRVLGISTQKEADAPRKSMASVSHTVVPDLTYSNANSGLSSKIIPNIDLPPVELADIPGMAHLSERLKTSAAPVVERANSMKNAIVDNVNKVVEPVRVQIVQPQEISSSVNKVVEPLSSQIVPPKPAPTALDELVRIVSNEEDVRNKKIEEEKSIAAKNINNIVSDIVNENTDKVDAVLRQSQTSEPTNFTHKQILLDEELTELTRRPSFKENLENIFKNDSEEKLPLIKKTDFEVDKVVKKITPEVHIINPIIEHFKEKTDAELQEKVADEEIVKQEVARVFDEAEHAEKASDYEIEIAKAIETQSPKSAVVIGVAQDAALSDKSELEKIQEKLALEPNNNDLRYKYATQLTHHGRLLEATEQLEILLDEDRTHVDSYVLLAYLAEQQGDFVLSLNSLEKVTLLKPNYPGIYYKLGRLTNEHFKKQNRKALRYFKEAITQDPSNADAQYRYALIEIEQNGDFKTAIAHLKTAVENAPQHEAASFELAKAYYEINDQANAAKWYARATELNDHYKTESNNQLFYYEEPIPEPKFNDNGLTVMITGATSGIGKATAELFAKNGYRVILTGRRVERLDEMKAEFEGQFKNRIQLLNFDVRSIDEVKKAVSELEEEFKNIDVLINNAGLASGLSPIHEGDIEDWDKMIDTNIKGLLYMTRAVVPSMVARRKGHIINISSIAGKEIYPNGNVYSASKFAVDALTRAMRVDLHKHNVRVSQVAPGAVEETEFALIRFHGDAEKASIYKDFMPLKASDVAEAIYFMVSRPEYVNIQDIVMMGIQQGSANHFDRSGRTDIKKNEQASN